MSTPLHLFDAFGIELEYMLVRQDTLDVYPAVDHLFTAACGHPASDYEDGPITWSNELVRHVMEVKVSAPAQTFAGLNDQFMRSLTTIQQHAANLGACLMPTAMHPWMDPVRETELWPHEYAEVYQSFDRIFNCRRHGWANLQSVHLNLPFLGDAEFARLHAAVRLVLPILPALAASSPVMDGRLTGLLDNRLNVYVNNSRIIAEIAGAIIPEPVYTRADYDRLILQPMFQAIARHDSDGTLQDEFLNARGAIARFSRNAIEIRLLDVQECPAADLAIACAVLHAVRKLALQPESAFAGQSAWSTTQLRRLLEDHIGTAEETVIRDADYLALWNYPQPEATTRDLWRHILNDLTLPEPQLAEALRIIIDHGTLARRMLAYLPGTPDRATLHALYQNLCGCLREGHQLA